VAQWLTPLRTNTVLYTDADPMADAALQKNGPAQRNDAFCRDLDPRVVQVSATLAAASHQEVVILRPEGTLVTDTVRCRALNISVIVEETVVANPVAWAVVVAGLINLIGPDSWQPVARESLRIALVNL
jgi:TldD protein